MEWNCAPVQDSDEIFLHVCVESGGHRTKPWCTGDADQPCYSEKVHKQNKSAPERITNVINW